MTLADKNFEQRVFAIRNNTRKKLEEIAAEVLSLAKKPTNKNAFENIKNKGVEMAKIIENTTERLVDHANIVISDFQNEINFVPAKEKYVEQLKTLLTEDCRELIFNAKDNAVIWFKSH